MDPFSLHIVLIEPEIPGNTGNIGRTCIGLHATLHLVGRLGFLLDDASLKRAGLDYWPLIRLERHDAWEMFLATLPADAQLHFFSTKGKTSFWDRRYANPAYLIFGSESRGFPPDFHTRYGPDIVRIPTGSDIRSLNLATAVGVAAFEAVRQMGNSLSL